MDPKYIYDDETNYIYVNVNRLLAIYQDMSSSIVASANNNEGLRPHIRNVLSIENTIKLIEQTLGLQSRSVQLFYKPSVESNENIEWGEIIANCPVHFNEVKSVSGIEDSVWHTLYSEQLLDIEYYTSTLEAYDFHGDPDFISDHMESVGPRGQVTLVGCEPTTELSYLSASCRLSVVSWSQDREKWGAACEKFISLDEHLRALRAQESVQQAQQHGINPGNVVAFANRIHSAVLKRL